MLGTLRPELESARKVYDTRLGRAATRGVSAAPRDAHVFGGPLIDKAERYGIGSGSSDSSGGAEHSGTGAPHVNPCTCKSGGHLMIRDIGCQSPLAIHPDCVSVDLWDSADIHSVSRLLLCLKPPGSAVGASTK